MVSLNKHIFLNLADSKLSKRCANCCEWANIFLSSGLRLFYKTSVKTLRVLQFVISFLMLLFEMSWTASVIPWSLTKPLGRYNSKFIVRSSLNLVGIRQNFVIKWNTDYRTKWHQIISSDYFTSRGVLLTNAVPQICYSNNVLWM